MYLAHSCSNHLLLSLDPGPEEAGAHTVGSTDPHHRLAEAQKMQCVSWSLQVRAPRNSCGTGMGEWRGIRNDCADFRLGIDSLFILSDKQLEPSPQAVPTQQGVPKYENSSLSYYFPDVQSSLPFINASFARVTHLTINLGIGCSSCYRYYLCL